MNETPPNPNDPDDASAPPGDPNPIDHQSTDPASTTPASPTPDENVSVENTPASTAPVEHPPAETPPTQPTPAPQTPAERIAARRLAKAALAQKKKDDIAAEAAAAAERAAEYEALVQATIPLVVDTTIPIPAGLTAQEAMMRQVATYRLIELEQKAAAATMGRVARLVESARRLAVHLGELEVRQDDAKQAAAGPDEVVLVDWNRIDRQIVLCTTEIGAMLSLSDFAASSLLTTSETLVNDLPQTIEALDEGEISLKHADIIVKHARQIPKSSRKKFEAVLLPIAKTTTIARLGEKAKAVREQMHPETAKDRHKKAMEKRNVTFEANNDGMATLSAFLPATEAKAIMNRVTDTARSLKCKEDERTLGQLRADTFQDLLLNGVTSTSKYNKNIRARVMVMIDHSTLMGENDNLAKLDGYGFIGADEGRSIAENCTSLYRVVYEPKTKEILNVGTKRYQSNSSGTTAVANMNIDPIVPNLVDAGNGHYRVPAEVSYAVWIRDQKCRWMGCGASANYCDLDHTTAWEVGGTTTVDNLSYFCRRHHRIKHTENWTVVQTEGGVLHFTSVSGRKYTTYPALTLNLLPADSIPVDAVIDDYVLDEGSVVSDQEAEWMGAYWTWKPVTPASEVPATAVPAVADPNEPLPF